MLQKSDPDWIYPICVIFINQIFVGVFYHSKFCPYSVFSPFSAEFIIVMFSFASHAEFAFKS